MDATPAKGEGKSFNPLSAGSKVKQVRYTRVAEDAPEEDEKQDEFWQSQVPYTSSAGAA